MANFTIQFHRKAKKQLVKIKKGDINLAKNIAIQIKSLVIEPRPLGVTKAGDIVFRIRIGNYRVIYSVFEEENVIVIGKIARRSEKTYSDLESITSQAINLIESIKNND